MYTYHSQRVNSYVYWTLVGYYNNCNEYKNTRRYNFTQLFKFG